LIISVHVPKTAGSSLRRAWETVFPGRVLGDYRNEAGTTGFRYENAAAVAAHETTLRERFDVVHGHFRADKYEVFAGETWIIFLREPMARVLSLHEQFRRMLERGKPLPRPEHEELVRAIEGDPARIVQFAEAVAGHYQRHVGRNGLSRFAVVGITEHYSKSVELLHAVTGFALPRYEANTSGPTMLKEYVADNPTVVAELQDILRPDIEIYQQGLAHFWDHHEASADGIADRRTQLEVPNYPTDEPVAAPADGIEGKAIREHTLRYGEHET